MHDFKHNAGVAGVASVEPMQNPPVEPEQPERVPEELEPVNIVAASPLPAPVPVMEATRVRTLISNSSNESNWPH